MRILLIIISIAISFSIHAQQNTATDSEISEIKRDLKIANNYLESFPDSSLFFGNKAYLLSVEKSFFEGVMESLLFLSKTHKHKKDYQKANKYLENYITLSCFNDSLFDQKGESLFSELRDRQNKNIAKVKENTIKEYKTKLLLGLLVGFFVFLLPILIVFFRFLAVKKRSDIARKQQEEKHLKARTKILERTKQLEIELNYKSQEIESRRKLREQQNKIYEQEKELMQKKAESLQQKLEYKNKELTTKALFIAQNNALISDVVSELKGISSNSEDSSLKKTINILQNSLKRKLKDNGLNEFELLFKEVHSSFYESLLEKYPDLSPNERKLCAFLRLNMTTKDISEITYQSQNTINISRTRLRKKLKLEREENLITFLTKI